MFASLAVWLLILRLPNLFYEKPVVLVAVQVDPARGPRSQVPVNGGGPTGMHFGHGWVGMPVR